jgi:hypothetical protein
LQDVSNLRDFAVLSDTGSATLRLPVNVRVVDPLRASDRLSTLARTLDIPGFSAAA